MKVKPMIGLLSNAFRSFVAVIVAMGVAISISASAIALSYTSDAPTTGELARERLKDQIEGVFTDEPNERLPGRVRGFYEKDQEGVSNVPNRLERAANEAQKDASRGLDKTRNAVEDAAGDARRNIEDFTDSVKDSVRDLVD